MRTGRGLRVLVVEDDREAAHSLAAFLELSGHTVQVALDGRSALRAVQAAEPDVALLDIGLPDIDGYQVAQCLQERSAKKRPLLVALTGFPQEEYSRRSEAAGIDLHLVKPADPVQLHHLLRRFEAIIQDEAEPPD